MKKNQNQPNVPNLITLQLITKVNQSCFTSCASKYCYCLCLQLVEILAQKNWAKAHYSIILNHLHTIVTFKGKDCAKIANTITKNLFEQQNKET